MGKFFKIAEEELRHIGGVLGEFPAGKVLQAIDMLRNLPDITHLFSHQQQPSKDGLAMGAPSESFNPSEKTPAE